MELTFCGIGESELNSTYLKWLFLHHILLHMYVSSDVYWVTMGFGNTPVLLSGKSHGWRTLEGCSPWGLWGSDTTEWLHFHFHALEKEMATHSSVLAWRIPGTGEPAGLLSMGSHRVGHDWSNLVVAAAIELVGSMNHWLWQRLYAIIILF